MDLKIFCIITQKTKDHLFHSYQQILQKLSSYIYTDPYMYSIEDLFKVDREFMWIKKIFYMFLLGEIR